MFSKSLKIFYFLLLLLLWFDSVAGVLIAYGDNDYINVMNKSRLEVALTQKKNGVLELPDIRFYKNANLKGKPEYILSKLGLLDKNKRVICKGKITSGNPVVWNDPKKVNMLEESCEFFFHSFYLSPTGINMLVKSYDKVNSVGTYVNDGVTYYFVAEDPEKMGGFYEYNKSPSTSIEPYERHIWFLKKNIPKIKADGLFFFLNELKSSSDGGFKEFREQVPSFDRHKFPKSTKLKFTINEETGVDNNGIIALRDLSDFFTTTKKNIKNNFELFILSCLQNFVKTPIGPEYVMEAGRFGKRVLINNEGIKSINVKYSSDGHGSVFLDTYIEFLPHIKTNEQKSKALRSFKF